MRNSLGLAVYLSIVGVFATACRSSTHPSEPVAAAVVQDEAPASGRYIGVAKPEQVAARLDATMDLVRLSEALGVVQYRAILRFDIGRRGGDEYAAVYLSDVTYSRASGAFSWNGLPPGMALSQMRVGDGVFSGVLTSAADKASLEFSLRREGMAGPALELAAGLPPLPSPTASYHGSCADQVSGLQIEASRWRNDTQALFGAVVLSGRQLQADTSRCSDNQPCLRRFYPSGAYDPLGGHLELGSGPDKLVCKILKDQLSCGDCLLTYDPISPSAKLLDQKAPLAAGVRPLQLPPAVSPATHASGSYYGYLHHEQTGTYQLVALNLEVERALQAAAAAPVAAGLQLSGVASAYFGEGDSSELIAYRFKPVAWSGKGPFVLDGDGEVFVVVEAWDDGKIHGTWYAKTRGRIGTIELQPKLVPVIAAGLGTMRRLSQSYRGGDWDFDLAATANLSEQPSDFYPLRVNGWAKHKSDGARRRTIKEGSFDFYTGRLALRLDDGRTAIGRIEPEGLQMFWPTKPRQGAPLSAGIQDYKVTAGSL